MTNTTNLTIQRRSIVGNADGSDTLILYCSEGDGSLTTMVLTVQSATSDDEAKFVKGTVITPTIAIASEANGVTGPTSPAASSTATGTTGTGPTGSETSPATQS